MGSLKDRIVEYNGKTGIWVRKKGGYAIFIPEEEIDPGKLGLSQMSEFSEGYEKEVLRKALTKKQLYNSMGQLSKNMDKLDKNIKSMNVKDKNYFKDRQKMDKIYHKLYMNKYEISQYLKGDKHGIYQKGDKVKLQDVYSGKYYGDFTVYEKMNTEDSKTKYGTAVSGYIVMDKNGRKYNTNNYRMKGNK